MTINQLGFWGTSSPDLMMPRKVMTTAITAQALAASLDSSLSPKWFLTDCFWARLVGSSEYRVWVRMSMILNCSSWRLQLMLSSVLEHLFCLPNICIAAHPCIYLCLAVKDFIFSKSYCLRQISFILPTIVHSLLMVNFKEFIVSCQFIKNLSLMLNISTSVLLWRSAFVIDNFTEAPRGLDGILEVPHLEV